MIRIENTQVYGFEAAIRGMRNPFNSHSKSDSGYGDEDADLLLVDLGDIGLCYTIGDNDMKLMKTLCKAGSDHRKFLRMVMVYTDVTAPLYWWKQADTYSVGKVQNSCSTMHKIADKEFVLDDFSHEHLINEYSGEDDWESEWLDDLHTTIRRLNHARKRYLETKVKPMKEESKRAENMKKYWWQMVQLLPSSYNQRRTVMLNYEVLRNQYHARKNHKLDEWHDYCHWIETLPYAKELIVGEDENK